jgi:predicted metal-dependent HD superfamily phosphohydrolase
LDALLRREHIYITDFFRDKYERTAKANIGRSLMNLRKG